MPAAASSDAVLPTVGIVNHNTKDHVLRLLDRLSATASASGVTLPIVVVDHESTDGSVEAIRGLHPEVVLRCRPNRGFAAGVNAAVDVAGTDVVVVLNSDVVAGADDVVALARALDRADVALAAPALVEPDGTAQHVAFAEPSPLRLAVQDSGLSPVLTRVATRLPQSVPGVARFRSLARGMEVDDDEPDWVLGAAFALRRRAWADVGGLDEDYFLYFEETDLCRRLRAAGWRIRAVDAPVLTHVGGASTAARRWPLQRQYFTSRARYVRRHHPDDLTRLRLLTMVAAASRLVLDLVRGPDRRAAVSAWLGVLLDAVRGWPEAR